MKKICLCLISLILIVTLTASASAVASLSGHIFDYAKAALLCLAGGDFDKLVTKLPYSGVSPSATEWQGFAVNSFSSLIGSDPQTKYAVGYWTGSIWKIAVPLSTPDSDGVEVFVLTSDDGQTFTGYGKATWGKIRSEYQNAAYVAWDEEYNASTNAHIEFDN